MVGVMGNLKGSMRVETWDEHLRVDLDSSYVWGKALVMVGLKSKGRQMVLR